MSGIDVERSVLGVLLLDSRAYEQAAELRPDDFSLDWHRRIFVRMIEVGSRGLPVDTLTRQETLSRHGELEAIGGVAYIASLIVACRNGRRSITTFR